LEVQLLGSGGFVPNDRRETACTLVRDGDRALLIDAGSGARRLVGSGLLDGVERLHVVLTHFHMDHVVGLFYAADLEPGLEVWAGGAALEDIPARTIVERLLGSPFAPPSFASRIRDVHELPAGEADVGGFPLRTRIQRMHSNPTLALRIGDALAWCTDTAYDAGNEDFARGVSLLGHEAFHAGDTTDDGTHTASGEAARLAAVAGVGRLVLIHVDPALDDDVALLRHAEPHFAETVVGTDGLVFDV
jgi:ribonuclease BN (tRNA processing enzyme)